tara:strand:+ start:20 stop:214 length:195 start_codon:yes stop_codon:yes gene_type:complete
MSIENMIKNIGDGENVAAGKDFESVIAQKMSAALDAKKIEIASTMGKKLPEAEEQEIVDTEEGL